MVQRKTGYNLFLWIALYLLWIIVFQKRAFAFSKTMGSNGYSLRLNGLEKNINDKALQRAIVMHGAPYVDQSAINSLGFLGRSWGCPAVPMSTHKAIINTIKGGTCLFIYSPDKRYQERSTLLNS